MIASRYDSPTHVTSAIVQAATRHGVELRPADVQHSQVDCSLEFSPSLGRGPGEGGAGG